MGRKRRAWFPGAKYHITSRGNNRSILFYDEEDRMKYQTVLKETKNRCHFLLHSYCLMTNHTHLQIETTETSQTIIMSLLNTKYAKYFNKKYGQTGHVFEKRYSAEILDSLDYEFDVSKYIHRNPLKAGIVDELEDYPGAVTMLMSMVKPVSSLKQRIFSHTFPPRHRKLMKNM